MKIISEETPSSKSKSISIIIGIIAFVAIVVACIFLFADDNIIEYDNSDDEDYTPRSCTIVVVSNGDGVGVYLATNASTYTIGGQGENGYFYEEDVE